MKVTLTALLLCVSAFVFADDKKSLFDLDDQQIQQEFAQLNELEAYVQEHGATAADVSQQAAPLAEGVDLGADRVASTLGIAGTTEAPLGIPPFLWGFCLGWVGILIVYLVSEDRDMTKKALIGCVISGAIGFIFYALLYTSWIVSST